MGRARGQLHVQKVPRWRLTIKNLQEDVEVARRRESLRSSWPEERASQRQSVVPVEGSSSLGDGTLTPVQCSPACAWGLRSVGEQLRVG